MTENSAPTFTAHVVEAMEKLFPLALADKSWDNVGLLLDNIPLEKEQRLVLLANDLTTAVCEEAIKIQASLIIAYHPFIFRGLKAITHRDTQQSTLLKLARHGIAVYSPHTSVDAAPGGINDWLADACLGESTLASANKMDMEPTDTFSYPVVAQQESRRVLQPLSNPLPEGYIASDTGYGREVTLAKPVPAKLLVSNVKTHLGVWFANIAFKQPATLESALERPVKSFAVCAGSGADVFSNCTADLLVTGELSHHAALKFAERGQLAVMLMHSSSERGFLKDRLALRLSQMMESMGVDGKVAVSEADAEIFHVYTG